MEKDPAQGVQYYKLAAEQVQIFFFKKKNQTKNERTFFKKIIGIHRRPS